MVISPLNEGKLSSKIFCKSTCRFNLLYGVFFLVEEALKVAQLDSLTDNILSISLIRMKIFLWQGKVIIFAIKKKNLCSAWRSKCIIRENAIVSWVQPRYFAFWNFS